MSNLNQWGKSLVALVIAAAGALATALGPGNMTLGDLDTRTWVEAILAVLGSAALVHILDNIHGVAGGVAKAVAAAATAGLGAFLIAASPDSALGDTVTQAEWLGVFITAVLATGFVYQTDDSKVTTGGGG